MAAIRVLPGGSPEPNPDSLPRSLAGRAWRAIQLSKSLWPPLCPGPRSRVLGPRGVAGTPSVEARSPAERRPLTRLQAGR